LTKRGRKKKKVKRKVPKYPTEGYFLQEKAAFDDYLDRINYIPDPEEQ